MRGLLSTTASRAWMGVVAIGVVIVAAVIGLQLVPRLGDGQKLVDAAHPAFTDAGMSGLTGGTSLVSQYVDLVDPLMTRKGDGAREVGTLIAMISAKTGVSAARARAFLRRTAPHTEALLRALPLSGVAQERRKLADYLATTLSITPDDLQTQLAQSFPRLYQTLSELPSVTTGWKDIPGIDGMTRFDGTTAVQSMPELRDDLRDDLVATAAEQKDHFQSVAGWGGIGYISWLLLIVGAIAIGFGILHARWSANHPSGRIAWGFVAVIGLVVAIVGGLQFVRLTGAQTMVDALHPAFGAQNVAGLRAGADFTQQAVSLGDPIMTQEGGGADEVPQLIDFVAEQTGTSQSVVRSHLQAAAPRTMALLEAIPLSEVADEQANLVAVLSHKLRIPGDRLVHVLRRRTPGLARALFAVGPVTIGWNEIPGTENLTRFDGVTPVNAMPDFATYLDDDVVPVFETQRQHFDTFADTWPPVDTLAGVVLGIGLLVAIYATAMLFLVTRRY